jgi:hypothetical protein
MRRVSAERIEKWEAELARIEDQILKSIRWGEARRFAARAGWNRHQRRNWLIDRISFAKAQKVASASHTTAVPNP